MTKNSPSNIAYIDGQNLYMGTSHAEQPWKIDCIKMRRYLFDQYNVTEAYYYIGTYEEKMEKLYVGLQNAGFLLCFRMHSDELSSSKKGNVDTDIVFDVMRDFHNGKFANAKVVLVSGDGDYIRMVQYLAEQDKLCHVLLPNRKKASSLYGLIDASYKDAIDEPDVRRKIEFVKDK